MASKQSSSSLWQELRQRSVIKVAVIYIAVAWVAIQAASILMESFDVPGGFLRGFIILCFLGFPLVLVMAWAFEVTPQGLRLTAGRAAPKPDSNRIAVLPLMNLSGDDSLQHFADGIAEDILTTLQNDPRLNVVSRNSSFAYRGQSVDVRQVAADLNVRYVLEGSVRKEGDTVRVTAQLIDALDDRHIWAQNLDRQMAGIFALQDELAGEISAESIDRILAQGVPAPEADDTGDSSTPPKPVGGKRRLVLGGAVVTGLFVLSYAAGTWYWASRIVQPRVDDAVAHEDIATAWLLLRDAKDFAPFYPSLSRQLSDLSANVNLATVPEGVQVVWRAYDNPGMPWQTLGTTPVMDAPLPRDALVLRLSADGYRATQLALRNPSFEFNNLPMPGTNLKLDQIAIQLAEDTGEYPDLLYVHPSLFVMGVSQSNMTPTPMHGFFIDRYEVTNEAYREFVAAGGYDNPDYWQGLEFRKDGEILSFEQAKAFFVDATGRPGPATWEAGSYPAGTEQHPVTGVSWYEAMAYARFRGRQLPTVAHWARAAFPASEAGAPLLPDMLVHSNLAGDRLLAVASANTVGGVGTYDMIGNAREWLFNATDEGGEQGITLGGAYSDAPYMATLRNFVPRFDRSPGNGIRLISDPASEKYQALAGIQPVYEEFSLEGLAPMSEDGFRLYAGQFAYDPSVGQSELVSTDTSQPGRVIEHVRLPVGYADELMDVMIHRPTHVDGPQQVVVFFPGVNFFQVPFPVEQLNPDGWHLDFLVNSGRTVIWPAWDGSATRLKPGYQPMQRTVEAHRKQQIMQQHWRVDLGRILDYLATRPADFDTEAVAYAGISYGATYTLPVLLFEDRIKTALLISGALPVFAPPMHQRVNFAPRLKLPTLMLNGKADYIFNVVLQQALYDTLGTPAEHKRYIAYDASHWPLPRNQMVRESLDWLDKYLGPVK